MRLNNLCDPGEETVTALRGQQARKRHEVRSKMNRVFV